MRPAIKTIGVILCSLMLYGTMAGCDRDGPMEEAGERVDEAVEETGDVIEETGERLQR